LTKEKQYIKKKKKKTQIAELLVSYQECKITFMIHYRIGLQIIEFCNLNDYFYYQRLVF